MLFSECDVLPAHHRQAAVPPTPVFETVIFQLFSMFLFARPRVPKVGLKAAQSAQKWPQGAKREPKRSLLGAKSITFRCQIGESGPLLKHQQGLCFHHIMRVRAPPFFLLKSPRERNVHRECSFSHVWLHFGRPSGTQGRPKGVQRAQKESQTLPRDA